MVFFLRLVRVCGVRKRGRWGEGCGDRDFPTEQWTCVRGRRQRQKQKQRRRRRRKRRKRRKKKKRRRRKRSNVTTYRQSRMQSSRLPLASPTPTAAFPHPSRCPTSSASLPVDRNGPVSAFNCQIRRVLLPSPLSSLCLGKRLLSFESLVRADVGDVTCATLEFLSILLLLLCTSFTRHTPHYTAYSIHHVPLYSYSRQHAHELTTLSTPPSTAIISPLT